MLENMSLSYIYFIFNMKMLYARFSPSHLKVRYQISTYMFFLLTLFMVGLILKEFFEMLIIFIMGLVYILSWMKYKSKKVNLYMISTHASDRFIIDSKTIKNLHVIFYMSGMHVLYLDL